MIISLQDEDTKEKIKNIDIQIKDLTGKIVASTEEKEKILKIQEKEEGYYIERLPIGEYQLLEISPKGYKQIDKQTLKIADTQEEQKVELKTRKLIFDVAIEKKLSNIIVNNKKTKVNKNDIMKVEIKERNIATQKVEFQYIITVKNIGETEEQINKIIDKIPQGLTYIVNENEKWNINNNVAIYQEDITLKPGERKEITMTLKWDNGKTNFGEKKNIVQIVEVSNPYKYKESNEQNNTDSVSTVVSVGTGLEEKITIIRIIVITLTACMVICLFAGIEILILKRKEY